MAKVNLSKGGVVNLKKVTSGVLRRVTCGMGWQPDRSGSSWDLDQSLVIMDEQGRYVKQISYKCPERSKEFWYAGDDLTGGSGKGRNDDEEIQINFQNLNPAYSRIVVIMNIYDAFYKKQDLYMVKNAYIRLVDQDSKQELVEYKIENSEKFKNKTGLFVGEFYKQGGEWQFQAIGEPVKVKNIAEMVDIIKKKYENNLNKDESWGEFLRKLESEDGSQVTPKKGSLINMLKKWF